MQVLELYLFNSSCSENLISKVIKMTQITQFIEEVI